MTTNFSRGRRVREIAFGLAVLLIGVPAMLLYGLLVEIPRDMWRYLHWSVDKRLSDALPDNRSHHQRQAMAEALLAQASILNPDLVDAGLVVIDDAEIRRFTSGAPSVVQDPLRDWRWRAISTVQRRASAVAPYAIALDPLGVEFLDDPAWRRASDALVSAASAALLGEALDSETRLRWTAAWQRLSTGRATEEMS